jgi:thymidylate kinase
LGPSVSGGVAGARQVREADHPVVVEFVGLPGAGKTTAARPVMEQLMSRGYTCGSRARIGRGESSRVAHYGRLGRFYLQHAGVLGAAVRLGLAGTQFSTARVRQAFKLSVWSYRLRAVLANGYDATILDQGPVQQACSTMLHGRIGSEKAVNAALRHMLLGAGVRFAFVYFDIDVDLSAARIARRPASKRSFGRLKGEEAKSHLAIYRRHLDSLLEFAESTTGAARYRVDGARPFQEICPPIVDFIETVLATSPVGAPL